MMRILRKPNNYCVIVWWAINDRPYEKSAALCVRLTAQLRKLGGAAIAAPYNPYP